MNKLLHKTVKEIILEAIVFISGASIMILELVGARLFAPYFGTSIYVWTSLIGIILISLSVGYWFGGYLADKKPSLSMLYFIILFSAFWILFIVLFHLTIFDYMLQSIDTLLLAVICMTTLFFAVPSALFAMVTPYITKYLLRDVHKTGNIVGRISALSTMGSIFGTFLTGFVLLPYFGVHQIFLLLSFVLFITTLVFILFHYQKFEIKIFLFLLFYLMIYIFVYYHYLKLKKSTVYNSLYNSIKVVDLIKESTKRQVRYLYTGRKSVVSAMYLDKPNELVSPYIKFFSFVYHFKPHSKQVLMLGGGAYIFPRDLITNTVNTSIDVVEIDPMMTKIAKKHFYFEEDERIKIYYEDARTYLNKTTKKYDAILVDVFINSSIPFHLTTKEAVRQMFMSLQDHGIVIMNIISSIEGQRGKFLRAELKTFKEVFPQVELFPLKTNRSNAIQNIILMAVKSENNISTITNDKSLNQLLNKKWNKVIDLDMPILTDDYAPVERYELERMEKIQMF